MKACCHSCSLSLKSGYIIVATIIGLSCFMIQQKAIELSTSYSGKFLTSTGAIQVKDNISVEGTREANGSICTWGEGTEALDCISMLTRKLLYFPASEPKVPQLISKRWVFMGDSTMAHLFRELDELATMLNSCKCQFNTAPRCNMYEAFGLTKKIGTWNRPVKGREGPAAHGLEAPHCQDCIGCQSALVECEQSPCNDTTISFIGIEFARDVEMQTELEGTNTTQESVARYLKNQQCIRHPFVCVVNSGVHDMIILNEDGEAYISNVEWYLSLLQPCCKHLIWIQMTASLDDPSRPQKNSIIEVWNAKVHALLQGELFSNWTSIVDPYNASLFWQHQDNVHLSHSYYVALADLFSPFFVND